MPKISFTKPALTYVEQLEQLEKRGLIIDNHARAIHLLESISYYRLSGYWYPLLEDKVNHIFKENSYFNTAFEMYSFDRALRNLIMRELEKVEVSLRAKIVYVLSHEHTPFWHLDEKLFKRSDIYVDTLAQLSKEYNRSREEFIIKFKEKYENALPPSWILLEISSFGTISSLYRNFRNGKAKRNVALYFGLSDVVLQSWMHAIVYLRNICAHHARLWNANLHIAPVVPFRTRMTWLQNQDVANNRTYFIMSVILYLLQTINPTNTFSARFKSLLHEYSTIDVQAMGFPDNWTDEGLWK